MRDDLNTKRRNAMEIRLKKVRDRKRLKMGLPLIEDDDTYPTSTDTPLNAEKNDVSIEDSVMESLKKLREKQETDKNKKASIREWDLGKEGVNSDMGSLLYGKQSKNDKPLMTQSEWVDDKRKQRKNEFAPPSIYEKAPRHNVDAGGFNKDKTKSTKVSDDSSHGKVLNSTYNSQNNVRVGPPEPKIFDNGLPQWNPGIDATNNHDNQKISQASRQAGGYDHQPSLNICDLQAKSTNTSSSLTLEKRLGLHRDMISNYGGQSTLGKKSCNPASNWDFTKDNDASETNISRQFEKEDFPGAKKRVEIAPPATAEYYNLCKQNRNPYQPSVASAARMKESLAMGIKKTNLMSNDRSRNSNYSSDSD